MSPEARATAQYKNGYTDFGLLAGETVFAQGDLLVTIESHTNYGITTAAYHALSKSRHEWFVEQVTNKITANYLDVMQLSAYAYIAPQPLNQGLAYEGQDMVFLEGDVTGPNWRSRRRPFRRFLLFRIRQRLELRIRNGFNRSFQGSHGAGHRGQLHVRQSLPQRKRPPAYAGTDTIWVRDLNGQPTETEAGISLSIDTDKKAYSAGEAVIIQGTGSDDSGPLAGASVTVNVQRHFAYGNHGRIR